MTEATDGGPAFPAYDYRDGEFTTNHRGMSLRDWFAGQALIALSKEPGGPDWRATEAYAIAKAMLLARAVRATPPDLPA